MTEGDPFRWTAATGLQYLSVSRGSANAITPDGSVIVGGMGTSQAFRWTQSGGMAGLGYLPGGSWSIARGVSSDGNVICGIGTIGAVTEAFRWTQSGGMVGLGTLPGSPSYTSANGISGDGQLIVGNSGSEAFVWDSVNGMQDLASVLENTYGLNLSGWTLSAASAISNDGSTIVGWGTDPSGKQEAWVVVIPEPSAIVLGVVGAAVLVVSRRIVRQPKGF